MLWVNTISHDTLVCDIAVREFWNHFMCSFNCCIEVIKTGIIVNLILGLSDTMIRIVQGGRPCTESLSNDNNCIHSYYIICSHCSARLGHYYILNMNLARFSCVFFSVVFQYTVSVTLKLIKITVLVNTQNFCAIKIHGCAYRKSLGKPPASISTICLDSRPVSGTRRLSGTRLLSEHVEGVNFRIPYCTYV